jgi:hypothetical protein
VANLWKEGRTETINPQQSDNHSVQSPNSMGSITAENIINSPISIQLQSEPLQSSKTPKPIRLKSDPRASIHQENRGISVDIHSDEDDTVDCYCVISQIDLDGIANKELYDYITEHSPRVSWSGGANGDVKHIDAHSRGVLNLVTIEKSGLKFKMHKGARNTGLGIWISEIQGSACFARRKPRREI